MRYRFKGIVRTTGQSVEGHAHGDTPEEAYAALSEHGIITESLREEPEALNLSGQSQPLSSAIDSALDTAAAQVPFESIAKKYTGKSVWVIDRDKIRKRVSQVVDSAIRDALASGNAANIDATELRQTVADAIGGLFKDNRNLTSQVSDTSMKLEHQIRRIEQMVQRQESLLAQMTIAIGRIGTGGGGGWGGGPRRHATKGDGGSEQNAVLLEIFKENLRLRGISIDEPPPAESTGEATAPADAAATATSSASTDSTSTDTTAEPANRIQRPATPLTAEASSPGQLKSNTEVELQHQPRGDS